ncbi:uncharacterized protein TM35_000261630 [Trypanosoma theileri]|uniref:Uncharacterized protein n=1 Tax=Trypanosoma theileri TaxID=67003 RepID=A0A1X0NQ31_9TRYP|nr:uncharacterized protein TM35_000261630 [Trypanosoma theileri]ORC86711.1 hypothetical protein TM35_000261630 [Trypanosoma theileri]
MFTVRCELASLWHPTVHHSLLLLRALKQRHTLLIDESPAANTTHPHELWQRLQYNSRFSITPPNSSTVTSSNGNRSDVKTGASIEAKGEDLTDTSLLIPRGGLECVRDPQHIPYFFSLSSSLLQDQLQAYLDADFVSKQILQGADDVLLALNTGEMELTRQTHGNLMDLVARLDSSLQSDDSDNAIGADGVVQERDKWSTWPLFTTLQFLVEEGGLLLGPFPQVTKAYQRLRESKPVLAHKRLITRTLEQTANSQGIPAAEPPVWVHRSFLREVQHRLANYTGDPAERMINGVSGEKGPLRERVSGARFGLQPVSARTPWTMQRDSMRKPSR